MERRIFIKNKSSHGGAEGKGKFYKIRVRLAKKQNKHLQPEGRERAGQTPRANSCSPRKMRGTLADIFKEARKVRSCETYLISATQSNPKNQEELASPRSKATKHPRHFNSNSHLPLSRSFSPPSFRTSLAASGKKDIYKTIEIRLDGNQPEHRNKEDLMTSLSKIILGEDAHPENYTFEILEESSIRGDELNYIDIDEMFLPEDMRTGEKDYMGH